MSESLVCSSRLEGRECQEFDFRLVGRGADEHSFCNRCFFSSAEIDDAGAKSYTLTREGGIDFLRDRRGWIRT